MSSRREVFIRILALLQRKTLIETKNRTLKCLKRHYSTVRSMKNVAVLTKDGAFALFCRPHPGGFDSSRVPTPGKLRPRQKNANARGSAGGGDARRSWNWLMHNSNSLTYGPRKRQSPTLSRTNCVILHPLLAFHSNNSILNVWRHLKFCN